MVLLNWQHYQQLCWERRRAFDQIDLPSEAGFLVRFAHFSANLTNFLPDISPHTHLEFFQEYLFQLSLETQDREITNLTDFCDFEGHYQCLSPAKTPYIFCAFHLGSYRALATWLTQLGYHFSILVRQGVYEQQLSELNAHQRRIDDYYHSGSHIHVLNAEDPSSMLKILRQLRAGHSLLVYMDGNTGTTNQPVPPTLLLKREIHAKQGAALLSYVSDVPILPVFTHRQADYRNVLTIETPILPTKNITKEQFAQQTTQYLYDRLSDYLTQYPTQWEPWTYVHDMLCSDPNPPKLAHFHAQRSSYRFNHQRYSLYLLKEDAALFDRKTYNAFEITRDLYDFLSQVTFKNPQKTLGEALTHELVVNQVLV